jgi:hypothetical protein
MTDETSELAGLLALLAFGWLFLANFLMNALVSRRGVRFGPIDLSKNTSPTGIEKLLNWSVLAAAVAAGVVTATMSVQGITHVEAKILIGGHYSPRGHGPDRWSSDPCGHCLVRISDPASARLKPDAPATSIMSPNGCRHCGFDLAPHNLDSVPLRHRSWRHSVPNVQPLFTANQGT